MINVLKCCNYKNHYNSVQLFNSSTTTKTSNNNRNITSNFYHTLHFLILLLAKPACTFDKSLETHLVMKMQCLSKSNSIQGLTITLKMLHSFFLVQASPTEITCRTTHKFSHTSDNTVTRVRSKSNK